MPLRIALFKDPLFTEFFKRWQFRNRFARLLVEMAHPLFLSTTFCKLLLDAKALRQLAGHLVNSLAFESRLDRLIGENHIGHVAAGGIQREVHLLRGGAVRQQNVRVFRRGSHMAVDDDDHLGFVLILQDFMRTVDIRMLVNQAVTGIVPDHLNRNIKLVFTAYPVTQGRHLRASLNRVRPHEHRNAGFNRVFQRRHTFKRQTV